MAGNSLDELGLLKVDYLYYNTFFSYRKFIV